MFGSQGRKRTSAKHCRTQRRTQRGNRPRRLRIQTPATQTRIAHHQCRLPGRPGNVSGRNVMGAQGRGAGAGTPSQPAPHRAQSSKSKFGKGKKKAGAAARPGEPPGVKPPPPAVGTPAKMSKPTTTKPAGPGGSGPDRSPGNPGPAPPDLAPPARAEPTTPGSSAAAQDDSDEFERYQGSGQGRRNDGARQRQQTKVPRYHTTGEQGRNAATSSTGGRRPSKNTRTTPRPSGISQDFTRARSG